MVSQTSLKTNQSDDFITIQDLFHLCLQHWYWFIFSLVITCGIAVTYLLKTPPVYTRSASLLIKDDSKSQSLKGDVASTFSDMGLFQSSTNVNNELIALQSPAIMLDVVKRLHLDITYKEEGRFYNKVLYGKDLPVIASFENIPDNLFGSFTLNLLPDRQFEVLDFSIAGEPVAEGKVFKGKLDKELVTPLGKLTVSPTSFYDVEKGIRTIFVSRSSLYSTVSGFSGNLSVALSDEKSTVVNLSFQDVNIQRAEEVLNTLIAVYNENWIKDKNQIAVSTSMFINDRLGVIEGELGNVDENISSFKSEHLLPDVQAASNMYMAQSSEANAKILALNTQISMARYIRNYLTGTSSRNQLLPVNSGLESANIENQISEYNAIQLQRNNLVANSSESNPLVMDMDQSLRAMRGAIITSVDNLVATLEIQIKNLRHSEQQTTARIASNPSQAKYLLSVERQQKVKESLYLFLLQKREENELSQAFTAYNTRLITPPTGSMLPTAPVRKNILLVAFALGILIPIVIIFLRENMNTKLRGKKDLDGLSIPFAGEIPLQRKNMKENDLNIIVKQGKRDVMNEAFRVLRTNLEFMLNKGDRIILATSFNPGSGKTFLSSNLAFCLTFKGKEVLIVDGDLRKATVSKLIGSPKIGLSDYLAGKKDSTHDLIHECSSYPNLHILPVGSLPPNPTELLESPRLMKLLSDLKSEYDYIFIDCPPIDLVADTQILGKQADRTLFVVRAGLMERSLLAELESIYEEKRFKNMTLVLNGTLDGSGHYNYKYGYRYGYGSSSYYVNDK